MNPQPNLQLHLFEDIKSRLPSHLSMVDELGDLLQISADSAYRRMRGEKALDIRELALVAKHFNVSLDSLLGKSDPGTNVQHHTPQAKNLKAWFTSLEHQLAELQRYENMQATYITHDVSTFQLFQFPDLAAFKFFLWMKSSLRSADYDERKFSVKELDEEHNLLARAVARRYFSIPTREIININAFDSTLKQIRYYHELAYFESAEDARKLCGSLLNLLMHIKHQSEKGYKLDYQQSGAIGADYELYLNELFVVDGIGLIESDNHKETMISTVPLSLFRTQDNAVFAYYKEWADNQIRNAVPLSGQSEKERTRYVNIIEQQITDFVDSL